MKKSAGDVAFPDTRHTVRRRSYMRDLPRAAGIPKFLRPSEIAKVRELKGLHPSIPWDAVVRVVVNAAVTDLS